MNPEAFPQKESSPRKNVLRAFVLSAGLAVATGCARPGVNVEMSRWVGRPYARVLDAFGQPAAERVLPDGRRLVTYEFPHTATVVNQFTNTADRLGAVRGRSRRRNRGGAHQEVDAEGRCGDAEDPK